MEPRLTILTPSLLACLKQSLSVSEANTLIDYAKSLVENNLVPAEPALLRTEGASFNPRVARVLEILIRDGEVRDLTQVKTALDHLVKNSSSDFPHFDTYEASKLLDDIRHLHMLELSNPQRVGLLNEYRTRFSHFKTLSPRLSKKIDHALNLQIRRG